jgi:c-di-GMP-binding flagellar brake protein YcgR
MIGQRRQFARIKPPFEVKVIYACSLVGEGTLLDLSAGGARISSGQVALKKGKKMTIAFLLPRGTNRVETMPIFAISEVVWHQIDMAGQKFEHLSGVKFLMILPEHTQLIHELTRSAFK